MTPNQLAKSGTEHGEQAALFAWCAVATIHGFAVADAFNEHGPIAFKQSEHKGESLAVPELRWFHAIPNGGSRGDDAKSRAIRGGQMKAEGVRKGVADTFLPVARGGWHGLYIEIKKPGKRSSTSEEQDEFGAYCHQNNYGFVVCDTWQTARDMLISYLSQKG